MTRLFTLVAVVLAVAACAGPDVGAAPGLELGRDVCEACGMIISDERFAAGFVDETGDHVFDDVGGLLLHLATEQRLDEVTVWVHDREELRWIEASTAHFVRGTGIRSPMEFGIASFADAEAAASYAREIDGRTMTWTQLVEDAEAERVSAHDHEAPKEGTDMEEDHGDH